MRALERSTSARWERRRRTDRVDLSSGWRTADVQKDRCASRSFLPSSASACRSSSRLLLSAGIVLAPRIALAISLRLDGSRAQRAISLRDIVHRARRGTSGCRASSRSRIKGIHASKSWRLLPTVRFLPLLSELSDYCALPSVSRFHQIGKDDR